LSSDFKSRCLVYDAYDSEIKNFDETLRSSLLQLKQEFDDVLASAMMGVKDENDNKLQAVISQIKQQEESISDVVETMGQQNSAQDKVIKEMRAAVAALHSS
jgi:hypothetical protein